MNWQTTVIKGRLESVSGGDREKFCPPRLVIASDEFTGSVAYYHVPTTVKFMRAVNAESRIGEKVIVTAIIDADGFLRDTVSMLYEP